MRSQENQKSLTHALFFVALLVLQCILVPLEASEGNFGMAKNSSDQHQETSFAHCVGGDCPSTAMLATVVATEEISTDEHTGLHADNCDHCCQCHGHSSHLAVLGYSLSTIPNFSSTLRISYTAERAAGYSNNIDRPPIS